MIFIDSINQAKVSKAVLTENLHYEFDDYDDLEAHYKNVESFVKKVAEGDIGSLILNGPAGLGKTCSVESNLQKYCIGGHKVINSHITLLSLYGELYHHKNKGQVLVLDDVDAVFSKVEGLNLLKAAMDTKSIRKIHWATSSNLLSGLQLPSSFEFNGGVILISNLGFGDTKKGGKLNAHLLALKDRSFLLTTHDTSREALYKQVCFMVLQKNLLVASGITYEQECEILNFIGDHLEEINEVSLRVAVKLAMLLVSDPINWKEMAVTGLLNKIN